MHVCDIFRYDLFLNQINKVDDIVVPYYLTVWFQDYPCRFQNVHLLHVNDIRYNVLLYKKMFKNYTVFPDPLMHV